MKSEVSVFNHTLGHTGFDFNHPPFVMVNQIAFTATIAVCKF